MDSVFSWEDTKSAKKKWSPSIYLLIVSMHSSIWEGAVELRSLV